MPNSLFHEEDHPRGMPENAGEFAPKKGGGTKSGPKADQKRTAEKSAPKSLFDDHNADTGTMVSAFEAAFSKPSQAAPLWQPKMFDDEPTGQKTFFDAGIEKGHGKPKKAAAPLAGPSLVEQIEAELSKMSKANKPLGQQKAMFHRRGAVERYQQAWDESKHPRDDAGRFSETHAMAHVGEGKPFREWTNKHAVPALQKAGYDFVSAQQIAFKAAQRVHRREKSEPIESAVKDALGTLHSYADQKDGGAGRQPSKNIGDTPANIGAATENITKPSESIPESPENITEDASIPDAPDWFKHLQAALEGRKPTEEPSQESTTDFSQPVDPESIHFKEWSPDTDDVSEAPPPVVDKLPDAVEPLSHLTKTPEGRLTGSTQMSVKDLHADPKRFQYKFIGVGDGGVTKELKDAKKFNPMLGGQLLVWQDPGDGKTYVINGHHRLDLAQRSLANGGDDSDWDGKLSVYFINASTPAEARALGAVTNIAEGRGTVVDAAKFLRDTGAGLDELEKHGVSVRGAMARDAIPLSKLSDRLWNKVAQETMTPSRGLAIAKHLGGDTDAQDQLAGIIDKREEKTGKDVPDSHVEEMAREMAMTPKHQEEGGGLFGDFFERSLLPERAGLKAAVRRAIAAEQNAFSAVSSTRRAGTLESEGKNTLDTEGNRQKAKDAARQMEDFEQQSNWAGHPIAAAVNEAAQRLANEPRKAKSIEKQLVEQVRGLLTGGADQLGERRTTVPDAGKAGGREGEPERHSRRFGASLTAMLERCFQKI